jgi:hypothetical protein
MLTAEAVRQRARLQPFIPFRLVTSTNRTYDVHHPDAIYVTRGYVIVPLPGGQGADEIPDQTTMIATVHLTELQDLPAPATSAAADD